MSKQISNPETYSGPESNDVYEDTETMQSFDDLDEFDGGEDVNVQGMSGTESDANDDDEDEEEVQEKVARKETKKKADAKKAKGQKGDDMEVLEDSDDSEDEEETEEEEEKEEDEEEETEEEEEKEEEKPEEKPADKKGKAKPTYVTVDGETFSVDSNALISLPVDGKTEKVTLQELKNSYNAKVVGDKRFDEINKKEIIFRKEQAQHQESLKKFGATKQQIEEIIKDPQKNPKDALKIFLDSCGMDSYDLMERMFKADLTELANVLNMEPAERKAYFLERKNSHLLEQSKKRDEQRLADERVTSYRQQVDALRKSNGVSEAQYVDALEELKSYGNDEKDLSERDIVEWAATKPHRETVAGLLKPYKDQLQGDSYGELAWKLANILRAGTETSDEIKASLKEAYGTPTKVKQLSKKLAPLGRKPGPKNPPQGKKGYAPSFDDIEDDE